MIRVKQIGLKSSKSDIDFEQAPYATIETLWVEQDINDDSLC